MTLLHITAGLLSLLAGAVALFTAKGMNQHRRWGQAFVAAMWVMTASGALIAAQLKPNIGSLMVALLTFYLVTTAWLTVRYPVEQIRAILIGGMLAAFALAGFAFLLGTVALHSPDGRVDRLPPQPMFGFGVIGLGRQHHRQAPHCPTSLAHVHGPADCHDVLLPRPGQTIPRTHPQVRSADHPGADCDRHVALFARTGDVATPPQTRRPCNVGRIKRSGSDIRACVDRLCFSGADSMHRV